MLLVICRVSALPVQVAGSQKELGASPGKGLFMCPYRAGRGRKERGRKRGSGSEREGKEEGKKEEK